MAQQFAVNVYQINSQEIPLASVQPISFPSAGVLIRGVASQTLANGVRVYGAIQYGNSQYFAMQSQATLTTAANA